MIKYTLKLSLPAKIVCIKSALKTDKNFVPLMVALLALVRYLGTGLWGPGSFEKSSDTYYIVSLGVWRVLWLKIPDYISNYLDLGTLMGGPERGRAEKSYLPAIEQSDL